jgi:hypothetical protein
MSPMTPLSASGFCKPLWAHQRNLSTVQYGTRHFADCEREDSGLLTLPPSTTNGTAMATSCVERCMACARCRYVSYASLVRTCAWYAHCDMDDLRTYWSPKAARASWHTTRVRASVPAPLPPLPPAEPTRKSSRPYRIALATLSLLGMTRRRKFHLKQGCGMLGWCQSAHRLKRALAIANAHWSVELVVLVGPISAKCVRAPPALDLAHTLKRGQHPMYGEFRAHVMHAQMGEATAASGHDGLCRGTRRQGRQTAARPHQWMPECGPQAA